MSNNQVLKKTFLLVIIIALKILPVNAQQLIWAKQMGGTSGDVVSSIALDKFGNLYSTGSFALTADFDPGTGTCNYTSVGYTDIFISKFDTAGQFIWARAVGGTDEERGKSIATDSYGNVYVTGFFKSTTDFDPGPGVCTLTPGYSSTFILKLSPTGDFVWAKKLGGAQYCEASGITIDAQKNVYTTGYFQGLGDFDPGAGVFNMTPAGSYNAFISKLDSNGNFIWAKQIGDAGYAINIDALGNVISTGAFSETRDFDPGPGVYNMISTGGSTNNDSYILKLDANGNFIWARQLGGTGTDVGYAISFDLAGNVYTAGMFEGTADFDPGPLNCDLISAGGFDVYFSKLNSSGDFVWAKKIGGTGNDNAKCIVSDISGKVYISGYFENVVDFDPGASTYNVTSNGTLDGYLLKLNSTGNFISVQQIGSSSYDMASAVTIDGTGNLYTGGSFSNTTDFDPGPGNFNLTSIGSSDAYIFRTYQCNSNEIILNETVCDTFIYNGNAYTSSGSYSFFYTNAANCDSIVFLNLSVLSTHSEVTAAACDSFTFNGQTYYGSGNYLQTLVNGAGCDSSLTLHLTINNVNPYVYQNGSILTAYAYGASYQWVDCNNNYSAIFAQTNQVFQVTSTGSYAVIVTENGCTDTSECFQVYYTGNFESDNESDIRVFANDEKQLCIKSNLPLDMGNIILRNIAGQNVVMKKISGNNSEFVDISGLSKGIYLIEIVQNQNVFRKKFFIN